MPAHKMETCHRGHNNWRINARGDRDCKDCRNERRRIARTQVKRATHGSLYDTMTYTEIMKARGYV